jgi:hypothetical protein
MESKSLYIKQELGKNVVMCNGNLFKSDLKKMDELQWLCNINWDKRIVIK